ncbi:hypothetical protein LWI29_021664 [Acer saccharum]|uniref:Uncharacterized protein n=1 Tax=Acer saccharum TaxID=4024 RepID=A0AA39SFC2_ACESA|nr:hypothetical protein LWI29_021664 [Acer saccharum]
MNQMIVAVVFDFGDVLVLEIIDFGGVLCGVLVMYEATVKENSRGGAAESVEIHNRRFGAAIMMIGVVLLVGYMMFSNKRVSSTSSYSKQMKVVHASQCISDILNWVCTCLDSY